MKKSFFKRPEEAGPKTYRHSDLFVEFTLCEMLKKKSYTFVNHVISDLEGKFPDSDLNIVFVREFLDENVTQINTRTFVLSDPYKTAIESTELVFACAFAPSNEISSAIHEGTDPQLMLILADILQEKKKEVDFDPDYEGMRLYSFFKNLERNEVDFENALSVVNPEDWGRSVWDLTTDRAALAVMTRNGLESLGDLEKIVPYVCCSYFYSVIDSAIETLCILGPYQVQNWLAVVNDAFPANKPQIKDILLKRAGFGQNLEKRSLEEVGQDYGLTRERIRQIVDRAPITLAPNFQKSFIYYRLILPRFLQGRNYVPYEDLKALFPEENDLELIAIVAEIIPDCPFGFDATYRFFYPVDSVSPDSIRNMAAEKVEDLVLKETMDSYDRVTRNILMDIGRYRLVNDSVYFRRGLTISSVILSEIDTSFPEGYQITDDFDALLKNLAAHYGNDFVKDIQPHSVQSFLMRADYCLVAKGTYKNRNYCAALTEDLVQRILSYIVGHGPAVYYDTIYNLFSAELVALGVGNSFYLKGLIDPYLETDKTEHRRDYIAVGSLDQTGQQAIEEKLRSESSFFVFDQICSAYPGVAHYVIMNAILRNKDFLLSGPGLYIAFDHCGIPAEVGEELKPLLDRSLNERPGNLIAIGAFLDVIKEKDPKLLEKYPLLKNTHFLFSFLHYLYEKSYVFGRPILAQLGVTSVSNSAVLYNCLLTLNHFSKKDFDALCERIHVPFRTGYKEFIESLSDDFVWADKDEVVKKNNVFFPDSKLIEVRDWVLKCLKTNGSLDTRQFVSFEGMPQLPLPWNKYLFAGILRSYFSYMFKIEDTNDQYQATDFVISLIRYL